MADDGKQATILSSGEEASTSAAQTPQQKQQQQKKVYQKLEPITPEMIAQEELMNNCAVKTIISGVMGSVLGVGFGVFMGAMDSAAPMDPAAAATAQKQTIRETVKHIVKTTSQRSISYAKGFGTVGALFAGSECVIEKIRAKHDIYNVLYAGCAAGGVLGISAGPKAACVGCVGFAAFSGLIEKLLEH